MKRLFAMMLALTLVLGYIPVPSLAEETTETTVAPTEEMVTEPNSVTVTGISVAAMPTKTSYQTGDSLELTGGSISVAYSDGTSQTVAMTAEMVSGFNNTAAFTQTLTVSYEGFEAYFDVTVTAPAPSCETEPTATTEGTTNATEPSAVSRTVQVSEKEISGIELTTTPTKIQYVVNQDELDIDGGVITVHYTDGSTETVDLTAEMVTNFDNTYVHSYFLIIRIGEWGTGYKIAIVESVDKPLVMDYSIDMGDSKTTYYQYESLELNGVTLTLEYSNGTIETVDVTSDMVTDFDTSTTGYHSFIINYNGESYWQDYYVITSDMLSGTCGDNAFWEISESGVLTISGSGEVVTRSPEGWPDIPWEGRESLIKTIVIENGITTTGDAAFSNCYRLTSVNLPTTLKEIGSEAFGRCSALTTISLPEGLTEIGYYAFYECTGLTEITFPKKLKYLGSDSFKNCTGLETITFEGKESPSAWDAFTGVTATGYYPGTTYWNDSFFRQCGGNIEWVAVGEVAESIKFNTEYLELYTSGEGRDRRLHLLRLSSTPGYVAVDCEFTVDNDIIQLEETSSTYCTFSTPKTGTATITATDKRSGCTATATIKVVEPKEITCPYTETIPAGNDVKSKEFYFTPEESGIYNITVTSATERMYILWTVSSENGQGFGSEVGSCGYLEAGVQYTVYIECASVVTLETDSSITFKMSKASEITGIKIVGGDRTFYAESGEEFWQQSITAQLLPENAIDAEITWESSNPQVLAIWETWNNSCEISTVGSGSATLTAKCGDFTDSIAITTQSPQKLEMNVPVSQTLTPYENYYFSFTPEETGRYAFVVDSDIAFGQHYFAGKYMPEDIESIDSGSGSILYGNLTAGVTYYFLTQGYDIGKDTCSSIITVKKYEQKPVAMELSCLYSYDTYMNFGVNFVPTNSYDKIVSWESSNTDILDIRYNNSGSSQSFYIYGSGEVTITAVSESGLRASCTVTVGQCYNGHTYGPWKQTKAKTCTIDGQETATCICGLRKYQPIPATGHNYDSNCDTECNDCGATRAAEHDFTGNWLYSETVHWHNCVNCGERSQIQNHIPGAAATQDAPQTCTECGYVIKGVLGHSHSYGTELTVDETGHWYACSGCNARKNYNAHSYTNVCDADCNDCGYTRKNVHVSGGTWVSDKAGHWQSCTKCNTKLDYAAHVPGAPATAQTPQICSICRYEIQKATGSTTTNTVTNTIYQTVTKPSTSNHTHKYSDMLTLDEVGHWYACSGCTSKREYAKHKFMNDCDADCDTCGYTRAVSHATEANWSADSTGHWYACKDCGEKIGLASHQAENGVCMICKHSAVVSQVPTATAPVTDIGEIPTTESADIAAVNTNTTEASEKSDPAGMPWWMMIVAGVVSSAGTLGIVAIVIWINRKKIVAMFMDK